MTRPQFAANVIQSAALLVGGGQPDDPWVQPILTRMDELLVRVWSNEFLIIDGGKLETQLFWDTVSGLLDRTAIPFFIAVHGPQVNPPGVRGRVNVSFKTRLSTWSWSVMLEVEHRLKMADYDLIMEKAGV